LRVLALDYGTARCGCAISDPTGTLVRPLSAIEPPDAARVAELVAELGADRVVVGLPVSLSGEEGGQAGLSRAFADELGDLLEVPVETYDERLTTTMADRTAREGAKADRDSLAAAHLLESYLARSADARGPAGEAEEPPDG
jgi:putative holliday junction resolvase